MRDVHIDGFATYVLVLQVGSVTAVRMPVRPASGAEEPTASAPQEYLVVLDASPLFSKKSGEERSIS